MIEVLLGDAHPVVREGVKKILTKHKDIVIADEAGTCRDVLKKASKKNYNVLMLDIKMPDRLGIDIIEELRSKIPNLAILIFSAYSEEQYGISAIRSGVQGYLEKASTPQELVRAIRDVSCGRKYISSGLAARMVNYLRAEENIMPHERLSSRELQVMFMLVSGVSVSNIADELSLSIKTVSTHRTRVLTKREMANICSIEI